MTFASLDSIVDAISSNKLPPVHAWNPSVTRDIDMRIARNGDWFYLGSRIQRERMVKLFSTVLRIDDGDTYLVTPQERLRITVDDAPFVATLVERHGADEDQTLVFTTNVGERVVVDEKHRITVHYDEPDGEPSPYLDVRDSLRALISRSAYYDLAGWAEQREGHFGVFSAGVFMTLGVADGSSGDVGNYS